MADLAQLWTDALPEIRNSVTGVGIWSALNNAQPIVIENDTFVLGLPFGSTDLSGHLRTAQAKGAIEREISQRLGRMVAVRVIDGVSLDEWETVKRKDEEARKLQQQAIERAKQEKVARTSWDMVYEGLARRFAATGNKSLPQNRAAFYVEALELVIEALNENPINDDLGERNFARCIERIAQYSEVPSTIVAVDIRQRIGK